MKDPDPKSDPSTRPASSEGRAAALALFLARMSHELRTPMNAIIGFADAMAEKIFGPLGDTRYEAHLTYIRQSAAHALSLIDDLMDIAKIEAGAWPVETKAVALASAIQDALTILTAPLAARNMRVTTSLKGDLWVEADPRALRQIFINLIGNAAKYANPGTAIEIEGSRDDGSAAIVTIEDHGAGMSAPELALALAPFQRLETSGSGTGLGLPIAKSLMEAMGGTFAIESTKGKGTKVTLHVRAALPKAQ